MAIAVQSVGATNTVLGSLASFTATFTKPTGLVAGDVMVGCFGVDGGTVAITTLTLSGWAQLSTTGAAAETSRALMLWKIADSGDVAASNFTFTTDYSGTGGGKVMGAIIRVDGFASTSSPQVTSGVDNNKGTTAAAVGSLSLTPTYADSLLIAIIVGTNNETGTGSFSGYSINGTNPTWTERIDIFDADADDMIVAVATAVMATAAAITTLSATCTVAQDDYLGVIGAFAPRVDATGTNTLHSVSPTMFTENGIAGTIGTNALHTATPEVFSQSGIFTTPTQWTNPDKPADPTWTNPNKL